MTHRGPLQPRTFCGSVINGCIFVRATQDLWEQAPEEALAGDLPQTASFHLSAALPSPDVAVILRRRPTLLFLPLLKSHVWVPQQQPVLSSVGATQQCRGRGAWRAAHCLGTTPP